MHLLVLISEAMIADSSAAHLTDTLCRVGIVTTYLLNCAEQTFRTSAELCQVLSTGTVVKCAELYK